MPHLRAFGRAGLRLADGRERLGAGKPLALLVYLACSPRRTATREHLLDLLWSDLPPDKARHALRQLIWYLRQALGEDAIQSRGTEITLVLSMQFDRADFLRAIAEGDAERATTLYTGDFLTGFAAPGGADFEHWADLEREQLRTVFLRTGESLARQWLREGRIREAQVLARRLRDTAPRHETAWRLLLESLVVGGDTLALTLEIAGLEEHWRGDNRELEPATRALLQRISGLDAETSAAQPGTLAPELVGREREFAELLRAWEQAQQGRMIHLHLAGAAGLGKSRLLGDAQRRLRGLGVPVVAMRATPAQRQVAYGFLGELVRAVSERPGTAAISPAAAGSLVALHPSLSGRFTTTLDAASGEEALRRRTAALMELLAVAADEAPFALLLDDMHWLDSASRQVLATTLERLEGTPLLCVTAARHGTGLETTALTRLELRPLDEADVAGLITSLGTLPEEAWASSLAAAVHHSADGIPLLVLETLQLALDRGHLRLSGGEWHCPAPAELAHQLRGGGALRARIGALSADDRWFLLLLALAGTALTTTDLGGISRRDPRMIEEFLSGLEHRGFLRRSGDQWLPAHDEIAALTIELEPEEARLRAHLGLGQAIAVSAEPNRLRLIQAGYHLAAAGRKAEVIGLFARYLGQVRRQGDGRRVGEVAYEFLGDGAAPAAVLVLVRGLPLWTRARWSSARSIAAAVIVTVVVSLGTMALMNRRAPEAELVLLLRDSTGGLRAFQADVRESEFAAEQLIPIHRISLPGLLDHPSEIRDVRWSPTGDRAVVTIHTGNSVRTSDLYLYDEASGLQLLSEADGDDGSVSWAPDGRSIVFTTARWRSGGIYSDDVARLRIGDSAPIPLTNGPWLDHSPWWSPDGSRIAFTRHALDAPVRLCTVRTDRLAEPTCRLAAQGTGASGVLGWISPSRFVVNLKRGIEQQVAIAGLSGDPPTPVFDDGYAAEVSPGGRFARVSRLDRATGVVTEGVLQLRSPGVFRPLDIPRELSAVSFSWRHGTGAMEPLADLTLPDSATITPIDANFLLTPIGRGASGRTIPLNREALEWRALDTAIAQVDTNGVVRPRQLGSARIEVGVGGWIVDTFRLEIVPPSSTPVLGERWDSTFASRWRFFGRPLPTIVRGEDGSNAFWNRGDGSYGSGAYSRGSWTGPGVGVEARISLPHTQAQWQMASLGLIGGFRYADVTGWDHGNGPAPAWNDPQHSGVCSVNLPAGETFELRRSFSVTAGSFSDFFQVDTMLFHRPWFRLAVQILPDGRCGVAIDGVPAWLSPARVRTDEPYTIVLGYSSDHARVLHGSIDAWTGVRSDIDWNQPISPR
ncbi:MAG: AAA family ATPase [Gemmatimonadales bacterium]